MAQALTVARINAATCPKGKSQVRLWDSKIPALCVRVYPSGSKSYWLRWKKDGKQQWISNGDVDRFTLADARAAARSRLGDVAKGIDSLAERRKNSHRLAPALDSYERSLKQRHVVKGSEYVSLLRRELLKPLGNVALEDIGLADVLKRVETVKRKRPGTAKELRTRAGVFMNWCASSGLIKASPTAGYRAPRRTRAQKLADEDKSRQGAYSRTTRSSNCGRSQRLRAGRLVPISKCCC